MDAYSVLSLSPSTNLEENPHQTPVILALVLDFQTLCLQSINFYSFLATSDGNTQLSQPELGQCISKISR